MGQNATGSDIYLNFYNVAAAGVTPGVGLQGSTAAMGAPNAAYSPSIMNSIKGGLTNMVGGPDNAAKINSVMGRLSKAQQAYKVGSGLLGGQPQGGGGGAAPQRPNFGAGASPTNFGQMYTQPNVMMQQQRPQLPPQLAQLPPKDPRVLAYLQQMGGMYG